MIPQQPLDALQHPRVIVSHYNEVPIWHVRYP